MSGTTPWRPRSIPAYRRKMPDAVIVDAVRTPIGKRRGSLADVHPVDLSAVVLTALAERTGIDPELVDDVLWGCVNQAGDQASQVGRYAVLAAGWPETVPGATRRSSRARADTTTGGCPGPNRSRSVMAGESTGPQRGAILRYGSAKDAIFPKAGAATWAP